MDNADVVSYLQNSEPASIAWMNTVLEALEQAHDLMVAQQERNAAAEQADEADAALKSQQAVDFLAGEAANAGNGLPVDRLNNVTDGAIKTLVGSEEASAANAQAGINSL